MLNQVSTWDFSTLYTSLPHAKLKHQLHDLLERVFNTRGKSFIATNNFHTFWANDRKSTKYTYFSCRELCLAIDFLIDNIYVRFGNSVFRQIIGIPMGNGGLKAMIIGPSGVNKCHQCYPRKCWEMPTVNPKALPLKSYVTRPRHRSPWECSGSRVTAARGECPAPLNNRNLCAKGKKTPTENHWPSRLGVGRGANNPTP